MLKVSDCIRVYATYFSPVKTLSILSDYPVNFSVFYALCILSFSNNIEFACPVEYEWAWICHIETKTLKVIVQSNQLSCCSENALSKIETAPKALIQNEEKWTMTEEKWSWPKAYS